MIRSTGVGVELVQGEYLPQFSSLSKKFMPTREEIILRIVAPHFCAGAVFDVATRKCIDAAPILKYMVGWSPERAMSYCKKKQWDGEFGKKITYEK